VTHGVLQKSNWFAIFDPVTPNAAMAEPMNGPVFGAREMKMGTVCAGFKTPRTAT
jgi:hypothetical protein